jgi:hypothetical protein
MITIPDLCSGHNGEDFTIFNVMATGMLCIFAVLYTKTQTFQKLSTSLPLIAIFLCFLSAICVHLQWRYLGLAELTLKALQWITDLASRLAILWFSYAQVDYLMRQKIWLKLYVGCTFVTMVVSWSFMVVILFSNVPSYQFKPAILIYLSADLLATCLSMYIGYLVLLVLLKKRKATAIEILGKIFLGPGGTIVISCASAIVNVFLQAFDDSCYYELLLASRICMLQIFNVKLAAVMQKRADQKKALQRAITAKKRAELVNENPELGNETTEEPILRQPMYEEQLVLDDLIAESEENAALPNPSPRVQRKDTKDQLKDRDDRLKERIERQSKIHVYVKYADNLNGIVPQPTPTKSTGSGPKPPGHRPLASPQNFNRGNFSNGRPGSILPHPLVDPKLLDEDTNAKRRKSKLDITTVRIQVKGKGNYIESGTKPPPRSKSSTNKNSEFLDMEDSGNKEPIVPIAPSKDATKNGNL